MQRKRYVVISPARDEQDFLEITIASVIAQSLRPLRWIIVDDGSKDRTPEILKSYSQRYDWIRVVTLPRREDRNPGPAGIYAFNAGLSELKDVEWEFTWRRWAIAGCRFTCPGTTRRARPNVCVKNATATLEATRQPSAGTPSTKSGRR